MTGAALRQSRQGRDQARGLPSPKMEDQGFLPRAHGVRCRTCADHAEDFTKVDRAGVSSLPEGRRQIASEPGPRLWKWVLGSFVPGQAKHPCQVACRQNLREAARFSVKLLSPQIFGCGFINSACFRI